MEYHNIINYLEKTFGKTPPKIMEHLKYFEYNDEQNHFICKICNKKIKLNHDSKKITTTNFFYHIQSKMHKSNTVSTEELRAKLSASFQHKIPNVVQNNAHILGMRYNDFYCEICEKILEVSSCPLITTTTFAQHLLTDRHENELYHYQDNVNMLGKICGLIPYTIYHNSQYLNLAQDGKNYFCSLCQIILRVYPNNLKRTEYSFTKHMETERHLSKSKQARVISRIPQLKEVFASKPIPSYVLKNIDCLSVSQTGIHALYCSTCDESFDFSLSHVKDSEQSLKCHILSESHKDSLKFRRDEVYSKLHFDCEEFPEDVLDKLDCIRTCQNQFKCEVCDICIDEGMERNKLNENIVSHLRSSVHTDKLFEETSRQELVLSDLEDVFGTIPDSIEDELRHIEYIGGINFKCTMCNKTLKAFKNGDYEENTTKTEDNFVRHFQSYHHVERSQDINEVEDELVNCLESFCSPTPAYLLNNFKNLEYKDNNDANNFFCFLCEVEINIANGPKRDELTLLNLRSHLLSPQHVIRSKEKANKAYLTKKMLKSIFGGVSDLILNNIQHLEKYGDRYFCKLCNAQLMVGPNAGTVENNFHSHLYGSTHQYYVKSLERSYDEASQILESYYGRIPEYILKNLDFLSILNDDDSLYCIACQEALPLENCTSSIGLNNNHSLRYHLESRDHGKNVGDY